MSYTNTYFHKFSVQFFKILVRKYYTHLKIPLYENPCFTFSIFDGLAYPFPQCNYTRAREHRALNLLNNICRILIESFIVDLVAAAVKGHHRSL